jgi:hypothetical protein
MPYATLTFLSLAFGFVPLAYIGTCIWLFRRRVHWLAYVAYFVLFGIVGGACLALALSPSGLTAICIVFLMTAGPVGCLACSAGLQKRRSRSRPESVAMIIGYCYAGLLAALWVSGLIYQHFGYG